ncbi:uncharacterized protein AMSG_01986 [Thecamonas trahens ATCC 50062]|uniref:Ubiquitin-related modifier 1 homolog n=1 Tax=Thecamonas trahens ATCC 50062 TaxID=461836 RepID=A0A0L0DUU1_THETB|nr:hypothetical protein AMSG_01986 [Thecamonas trahens ATCC 50062]KNC55972.1 hypothetical protein AMSG_01986 [Thecamonas trahens ATCC 50062]|eukprot:XP_013761019.1 hypothetical protein AMSG_01986 [Thecamonas trahens ATCC 50062]
MDVTVHLSGGLDVLFGGASEVSVHMAKTDNVRLIEVLNELMGETLVAKDRGDMLMLDGEVRPGILVLINDADWALLGENEAVVTPGDEITLISTLHGG